MVRMDKNTTRACENNILPYPLQVTLLNMPSLISSFNILPPHAQNRQFCLGSIPLGATSNVLPQSWNECMVLFRSNNGSYELNLKMIFDAETTVIVRVNSDISFIRDVLLSKLFAFWFSNDDDTLIADIFLKHLPLDEFSASHGNLLKRVFTTLLNTEFISDNLDINENDFIEAENLSVMYRNIKEFRDKNFRQNCKMNVQHPHLKSLLLPYQQNAVRWMLQRELFQESEGVLHPLYVEVKLKTGSFIYFNKFTGYVDNVKPLVPNLRTGGILADEMGLGKTIEMIACILLSPNPTTLDKMLTRNQNFSMLTKTKKRKFEAIQNLTSDYNYKKLKLFDGSANKVQGNSKYPRMNCCGKYNNLLSSLTKEVKDSNTVVSCICGSNNMTKNMVQCVDCLTYQHGFCVNYKRKYGDYRCSSCWMKQPPIESKATLIVCPALLRSQWIEEISKHVACELKIFVYEGIKATPICPEELADNDIVITSYTVIQSEYSYMQNTKIPKLRHARRYAVQGSSLFCIKWWRLCLDEAQLVEVSNTKISEMVKKINAQHRWVITETPITTKISGLQGVIKYLQMVPYNEYETWNYLLYVPYKNGNTEPMCKFLAEIMWHSSKAEVIDQMNLPTVTIKEHLLEFCAVDSFFYRKEHSIAATEFHDNLTRLNVDNHTSLTLLKRTAYNNIMGPLSNLRQVCSNANAIRGRYLVTRKQITSMKDLLEALIAKSLITCKGNLVTVISILNGLAGISLLANNPCQAVIEYRKVLAFAARFNTESNFEGPTVDTLQLIHAIHNLSHVFKTWTSVEPMIQEYSLQNDCLKLEEKFMEQYITQSQIAIEESEKATLRIKELKNKFNLEFKEWYLRILTFISAKGFSEELVNIISTAVDEANIKNISSFSDVNHLFHLISTWEDEIECHRVKVNDLLSRIYHFKNGKVNVSHGLVQAVAYCHLRPQSNSNCNNRCFLCKTSEYMRAYENKLFEVTQNHIEEDETTENESRWKQTWTEIALKGIIKSISIKQQIDFVVLVAFVKDKGVDEDAIHDSELCLNLLYAIKREFQLKHTLWNSLRQQINALDKVNVCKERLQLSTSEGCNEEYIADNISSDQIQFMSYIQPSEIAHKETFLQEEEIRKTIQLENNLGTYKYLKTLQQQQYSGQRPDPCPICHTELLDHWSIFPCGHCYCLDCIDTLIKRVSGFVRLYVTCCVCRQRHHTEDISYIHTEVEASADENKIKGDYSTKIEAIVKLIIKLRNNEDGVKVLIYSTWMDVLSIIHDALRLNGVNSETLHLHNYINSLSNFKNPAKAVTVLLLPIHLGSKGLNLINATHVIFVEPLLNPTDELQAIGRVYRMGQTKPTTIHKFIIKNSVEENISKATTSNAEIWSSSRLTLDHLRKLFVISNAVHTLT